MARIVLADDGIAFDGRTPEVRPLGGAESAVVNLVGALARRGHSVTVRNRCDGPLDHDGVAWRPIGEGIREPADLYIANRGHRLIDAAPAARRTAFWLHNPAGYILKWRYLWRLWRVRPALVFLGAYHASTCPRWVPNGGRHTIPYGIDPLFRDAEPAADPPPAPRAVFASNPLRGLDWLVDVWAERIRSAVPGAELHIFSGTAPYGTHGDGKADAMNAVLEKAAALAGHGVVRRDPVPKPALLDELRSARALLYKGDVNETFCLAVGEAQAAGLPAVVTPLGAMPERVADGVSGTVAADEAAFAEAAVRLLTDDAHWRAQQAGALRTGRAWGWDDAAAAFEALVPEDDSCA